MTLLQSSVFAAIQSLFNGDGNELARTSSGRRLHTGDRFILQYPHHNTAVLSLSLLRFVAADLMSFSHGTWRQHSGKGNVRLLDQNISYLVGAVFAKLLVQIRVAHS